MVTTVSHHARRPAAGEPVWEIARLYPPQGQWRESEYFAVENLRRCEFTDGYVEFLPVPTSLHQRIQMFLIEFLLAVIKKTGRGTVWTTGTRVRIRPGMYREPDVAVFLGPTGDRDQHQYLERPDIVFEIVSPDDPDRDLIDKRSDYAEGRIPEYWIIDPRDESVTVLDLSSNDSYVEHGRVTGEQTATSCLVPDLRIEAKAIFDAGRSTDGS